MKMTGEHCSHFIFIDHLPEPFFLTPVAHEIIGFMHVQENDLPLRACLLKVALKPIKCRGNFKNRRADKSA
ncbi:hypothetical protein FQZ97_1190430 [compost metagenome]